jgi:glyoxylase-like metal-dependent hydrolase (beta-lactamase superfamily II)
MSRLHAFAALALGAALVTAPAPARAQAPDAPRDSARLVLQPLRGELQLLRGPAATLIVAPSREGVLLIDGETEAAGPRIDTLLATRRVGQVRRVAYTHHHREQVGGGDWFYGEGAELVSSLRTRERLAKRRDANGRLDLPVALPDRTFTTPFRFRWGANDVELRPVGPAHTDGDVVAWFRPANVVHVGDLFRGDGYPQVDLEGGGTIAGTIAVLTALATEMDDRTIVVASRGPVGDRRAVRDYLTMLAAIRARVLVQVRAGRSENEVATSGLTGDFEPRWGRGTVRAEQFLRQLAREITLLGR